MRFGWRDGIATALVALGVVVYVAWLVDRPIAGLSSVRSVAVFVLATGFVASASAVVPTFDELLHGSKTYLAITSVLGLAALVTGVLAIVQQSEAMLAILVGTTVAMWVLATARHTMRRQIGDDEQPRQPVVTSRGTPGHAV